MQVTPMGGRVLDVHGDRALLLGTDGTLTITLGDGRIIPLAVGQRQDMAGAMMRQAREAVTTFSGVVEVWGHDPEGPLSWYLPDGDHGTAIATCPGDYVVVGTQNGKIVVLHAPGKILATLPISSTKIVSIQGNGGGRLVATDEAGASFQIEVP